MIKLTNFQKRILKQNLAEIAAKNTKTYFGDLVFAFEWIDNHEEFKEKTIIFILGVYRVVKVTDTQCICEFVK